MKTKKDYPQLETISFETISKVVKNCTTPKQEKINISSTWENVLPQMVRMYSSLNSDGKKEVLRRMSRNGLVHWLNRSFSILYSASRPSSLLWDRA